MFRRKKQEEEDVNVLMLMRVEDMLEPCEGSTEIIADCGCRCWISPTSMAVLMDPDVKLRTTCMVHVDRKKMEESLREHGMLSLPGALDEIREKVGDDPIAQMVLSQINEIYPNTDGSSK